MERFVEAAPGVRLWVQDTDTQDASALLLIMGANASGLAWPDPLVDRLAERHRVIRYDHRDTGRSAWGFDEHPYAIAELADDAVAGSSSTSVSVALAEPVARETPEPGLQLRLLGQIRSRSADVHSKQEKRSP